MYRIRLHGRGGQGIKTASRILGSALFAEGFEVQDAPRYGAERRGAPIFATVRAARAPIHERGVVGRPDLVVVADDTLIPVAAAGVMQGVDERCVLLVASAEPAGVWRERLKLAGALLTLPPALAALPELAESPESGEGASGGFVGTACAGAAARMLGVVSREALEGAIRQELAPLGAPRVAANLVRALAAYDRFEDRAGCVSEGPAFAAGAHERPDWIDLPLEEVGLSAPDVHASATSVMVRTGLWRTMRPVIDAERCNRCVWVCSTFCPDGAIAADEAGAPRIDYDHCKGCLVCVAVCPPHAIRAVPEQLERAREAGEAG